jgi:hypothetical protein
MAPSVLLLATAFLAAANAIAIPQGEPATDAVIEWFDGTCDSQHNVGFKEFYNLAAGQSTTFQFPAGKAVSASTTLLSNGCHGMFFRGLVERVGVTGPWC